MSDHEIEIIIDTNDYLHCDIGVTINNNVDVPNTHRIDIENAPNIEIEGGITNVN